jgi:large subunit ribosomal protein L7/L12
MAITKAEILEAISSMTVLELSELVKEFEEKFGVSAAPVMAAGMMPMAGGAAPAAVEEKTEFDVVLTNSGEKKINVIKVMREVTGLGLKEAKDAVEGTPYTIKEGANKADAEAIKAKFEAEGAKVEIK